MNRNFRKDSNRRDGVDPVTRARARRRALQAIYAWQISGGLVEQVIAQFAHEQAHEIADLEYFDDLVRGVVKHRASLDEALVGYLDRVVEEDLANGREVTDLVIGRNPLSADE